MPKMRKIDPPPDDADEAFDEDDTFDDVDVDDDEDGSGERWGWYTPSRPIRTERGIKARSQRGAFGESWWAKRWIAALEQFGWGSRLQRGKSYARQGQVLAIDFVGPKVRAKVQGSRPTPYAVTIEMKLLTDTQWEQVIAKLAQQALFAAKLLAGEMPQDIESAFDATGVPLFPRGVRDISAACSCPDGANPCKHIAAVYYLLGERFDDDPFLIFQVRGRTREQISDALRALRAADIGATSSADAPVTAVPALTDLLDTFYQTGADIDEIAVHIAVPEVEATLLKRLGPPPAMSEADLRAVYRVLSQRVMERVFGGEDTGPEGA